MIISLDRLKYVFAWALTILVYGFMLATVALAQSSLLAATRSW